MILRATCLALSIMAGVFVNDASAHVITWAAPQTVAASSFDSQHPRIVLSGNGNPVILWGNSAANAAYLSRWTGSGFTSPVKLNSMGISIFADSWAGPDLASKGDTVYAIFKAKPEDTAGIYIVRSFNGGATLSMPARWIIFPDTAADSRQSQPMQPGSRLSDS